MSRPKPEEKVIINHYMTASYFKSKDYFVPLPESKRLKFYHNLIREVKKESIVAFRDTIVDTLKDHVAYIEKESNFKKTLTKEQQKQFDKLREQIVMWYDVQKEVMQLGVGENEIVQISIQQQQEQEDDELEQKIKNNKYYNYGLEEFNREDENCDNQKVCYYGQSNIDRGVYCFDDPPVEYKISKETKK